MSKVKAKPKKKSKLQEKVHGFTSICHRSNQFSRLRGKPGNEKPERRKKRKRLYVLEDEG